MLLYVLESKGSSPGRRGFHMAVSADGGFHGTIGGGIMEYKFVEMARAKLMENTTANTVLKQVHDKAAAQEQSGMICSGEQTIYLYKVRSEDAPHIASMAGSLSEYRNGTLRLSNDGIVFTENIPAQDFYFEQDANGRFLYIEKTGLKNRLFIIGGGHCGYALSKMMYGMDFYITLIDERHSLNTIAENNFVHEKKFVNAYTETGVLIEGGENVYVVIMTVGYRTDELVLQSLAGKDFKYMGMLGSLNKIRKMMADEQLEIPRQMSLDKLHAPVGLQIKSQTAQEIAVSIAAEIIAVKNKDQ